MRALVTGGAGFIGSAIVRRLAARGWEVTAVDALDRRVHATDPPALPPEVVSIRGDIGHASVLRAAFRTRPEVVFHEAALGGLGRGPLDAEAYLRANVLATLRLLRAMGTGAGPPPRMVLASSMAVYGEGAYRCERCDEPREASRTEAQLRGGRWEPSCPRCRTPLTPFPVPESWPTRPSTMYARSKQLQEALSFDLGRSLDVPVVALRYHNVYGPWMPRDSPYSAVAANFKSRLAAGLPPVVFEDGAQRRDFVHVDDVARANELAALAPASVVIGRAFNIGTGRPSTILSMARALAGRGQPRIVPVVTGQYRQGDARHIYANVRRAARSFGWRAKVPLEEGLVRLARDPLRPTRAGGTEAR